MACSLITYSVFLFRSVVSLADANAEALIADGLIGALSYGLAALVGDVASHLRSHWRQLKLVLTIELSEVSGLLRASEGRNWQLECAAGRLWHALSDVLGLIGRLGSLNWQDGSKNTRLGGHKLGSDLLVEA